MQGMRMGNMHTWHAMLRYRAKFSGLLILTLAMLISLAVPAVALDGDIIVGNHPLLEKFRHKSEGYYLPLIETAGQFGIEVKINGDEVFIKNSARGDFKVNVKLREVEIDGKKIDIGAKPIMREKVLFYPLPFFEDVLGLDVHGDDSDTNIYISRVVNVTDVAPDGVSIDYKYDRSYSNFELDDGDKVRLVVDLDAAIIHGKAVEKSNVGDEFTNLRVAQFNSKPDIVRVVLELKKRDGLKPEYRIEPKPGGLWIGIGAEPFKVELESTDDGCAAVISGGRYENLKDTLETIPGGGKLTLKFTGARFPENELALPGLGIVSRTRITDYQGYVDVVFDLLGKTDYSIEELPGHKIRVSFKGSPGDLTGRVIVIDPGHGGRDPGAMHANISEKDLNLEMARYLADELRARGATVFMTRNRDVYLSLEDRLDYAKRHNADLLIAVHTNSSRQPMSEIHGPMLIFDEECNYRDLLSLVYEEMVANGGRDGLGPRLDDRGLYLLRHRGKLPILLLEAAFMNNPKDITLLTQPEGSFKKNLMHGVAIGILRYYTGNFDPSREPIKPKPSIDPNLFGLVDEPGLVENISQP